MTAGLERARPILYGYMRRLPGMTDIDEARTMRHMAEFADREGYALEVVFVERLWTRTVAIAAVIDTCLRTAVHDIVVPSHAHLNSVPFLSLVAQADIERQIEGRVWIVSHDEQPELAALTQPETD